MMRRVEVVVVRDAVCVTQRHSSRDGILRGAAQKKKGQKKGRPAVWSNVIYLSLCYVLCVMY